MTPPNRREMIALSVLGGALLVLTVWTLYGIATAALGR